MSEMTGSRPASGPSRNDGVKFTSGPSQTTPAGAELQGPFKTREEAEAEVAAYNRDRCACGGSPSWVDPNHQFHRADCEVHRGR